VYALSNGFISQLDVADQALLLRRAKTVMLNVGDVLSSSDATTLTFIFRSVEPLPCMWAAKVKGRIQAWLWV
jgi:hypothetical protein